MKIEFLPNVSRGEHVLRLFDFDRVQAQQLSEVIREVITEGRTINLAEREFIQPVNCDLSLRIAGYDQGILTDDDHHFYCKMSISGYESILKLLEPFCNKESRSYTWLYDLDNPIDFLLSAGEFVPVLDDEEDNNPDEMLPLNYI